MSTWVHGTVKAVLSGDSLLVMGKSPPGTIGPEKVITLAAIIAPKLGRRGDNPTRDEPFAWHSREFLRKKCIGQTVTFRVDYAVPSINREFGTVFLNGENIGLLVVQEGWAKVRQGGNDSALAYSDDLLRAEAYAQELFLGMYSKDPAVTHQSVRKLPDPADPGLELEAVKGRPQAAIVEAVLNGSCLRLALAGSDQYLTVFLSGVQAPSMNRRPAEGEAGEASPEPFARESKHFSECKVLHREVRLVVEAQDKYNNLVGNCFFTVGGQPVDLAEALVRAGLAKVTERTIATAAGGGLRIRTAERAAKEQRLGLWRDWTPPVSGSNQAKLAGRVVEVVSGDTLVVLVDGAERRFNLASVRAPRMGNARKEEKPAPYALEAKEFLRQRVIGRQVTLQPEYTRRLEASELGEARTVEYATAYLENDGKGGPDEAGEAGGERPSVQELLAMRGLVAVIKHRNDEERSERYDMLLAAESRALKEKKGIHNPREAPARHVNDLSRDAARAKQFLPFLQRAGRTRALCEYVLSGHKLKLLIVKENVQIAFALSGVRCPGRGADGQPEPFAEASHLFTRRHFLQRECDVVVETMDKTGTFLGACYAAGTGDSLGRLLLERGLASTSWGIENRPDGRDLAQVEAAAKEAKRGLWEHYVEPAAPDPEQEAAAGAAETVGVTVTEVLPGGRVWLQLADSEHLRPLEEAMSRINASGDAVPPGYRPTVGQVCRGRFTGDNSWYRALVTRAASPTSYEVFYVDFGNSETLDASRLGPLDPAVAQIPRAAHLAQLAFVKVPDAADDYGHEAAQLLGDLVAGKRLAARVEGRDRGAARGKAALTTVEMYVTLEDPEQGLTAQGVLVQEGLARVDPKGAHPRSRAFVEELKELQEQAHRERAGMWQFGDAGDDEEDSRPRGGAPRRK